MTLYIDGGCDGNQTTDIAARRMVSVVTDAAGVVLSEHYESGGSNNIAELIAARDALQIAVHAGQSAVQVFTDSRNNLAWIFGRKVGKHINDRPRVLALKSEIDFLRARLTFDLTWVPREQNIAGHYLDARGCG